MYFRVHLQSLYNNSTVKKVFTALFFVTYFIVLTKATLVVMGYGAVCGWPSPAFPILQSAERTPLKSGVLNNNEVSWVGSIMCPGGLLGTLICGWMCEKFGRKISICSAALPQIVRFLYSVVFSTMINFEYL